MADFKDFGKRKEKIRRNIQKRLKDEKDANLGSTEKSEESEESEGIEGIEYTKDDPFPESERNPFPKPNSVHGGKRRNKSRKTKRKSKKARKTRRRRAKK